MAPEGGPNHSRICFFLHFHSKRPVYSPVKRVREEINSGLASLNEFARHSAVRLKLEPILKGFVPSQKKVK
jgi:hypothetical protein